MDLLVIVLASFFQNMAFTWSSRSRNSGDPAYHFRVALLSNGLYILLLSRVIRSVFDPAQSTLLVIAAYTFSTAAGSATMMKILLRTEKGKRRVGSA